MRAVGVCGICVAAALAALPALPAPDLEAEARTGTALPAVWKEQRLEFLYLGRTSRYSCEGLQNKVRALLLDLGARRDLKIESLDCRDLERSRTEAAAPRLRIAFFSPALPSAAKPAAGRGATVARFEKFNIANDAFRNLGVGDCELVEEFARQILPRLAARGLREDIRCAPGEAGGAGRFLVTGEVLRESPRSAGP